MTPAQRQAVRRSLKFLQGIEQQAHQLAARGEDSPALIEIVRSAELIMDVWSDPDWVVSDQDALQSLMEVQA